MKIRVLVVDDSAVLRLMLTEIINASPDMHVVATAGDEKQAREAIRASAPDVMTLDATVAAKMAERFLRELKRTHAIPVLMLADAAHLAQKTTLNEAEHGVIGVVARPRSLKVAGGQALAEEIRERIRAQMRNAAGVAAEKTLAGANKSSPSLPKESALPQATLNDKIIVIGASTGGTEAIREVLMPLPAQMPPILIVQHMPELFTASFAKRLDSLSRIHVKEAEHGEAIRPGTAYLAPGHSHLSLKKAQGGGFVCELADGPPVNRHRPSVDVLFLSAAKVLGPKALGVLLTGMGKDGAQGLLAMRQAGAWTVAQDEASSVVWGMPREAILIGGAHDVAALKDIPQRLLMRLGQGERRAVA